MPCLEPFSVRKFQAHVTLFPFRMSSALPPNLIVGAREAPMAPTPIPRRARPGLWPTHNWGAREGPCCAGSRVGGGGCCVHGVGFPQAKRGGALLYHDKTWGIVINSPENSVVAFLYHTTCGVSGATMWVEYKAPKHPRLPNLYRLPSRCLSETCRTLRLLGAVLMPPV